MTSVRITGNAAEIEPDGVEVIHNYQDFEGVQHHVRVTPPVKGAKLIGASMLYIVDCPQDDGIAKDVSRYFLTWKIEPSYDYACPKWAMKQIADITRDTCKKIIRPVDAFTRTHCSCPTCVAERTREPTEKPCDCCDRAGEYNGYNSDGPRLFTCPKGCSCHD